MSSTAPSLDSLLLLGALVDLLLFATLLELRFCLCQGIRPTISGTLLTAMALVLLLGGCAHFVVWDIFPNHGFFFLILGMAILGYRVIRVTRAIQRRAS